MLATPLSVVMPIKPVCAINGRLILVIPEDVQQCACMESAFQDNDERILTECRLRNKAPCVVPAEASAGRRHLFLKETQVRAVCRFKNTENVLKFHS
jgi:hypothetical protein